MRVYAKPSLPKPFKRLPMRCKRLSLASDQVVCEHVELSRRDNSGIELPDCSRRGIARISKSWLALLFPFRIDLLENGAGDEYFTAHLNLPADLFCGVTQFQRHTANRPRVL